MKRIFQERRQAFLARCVKYSRYVLNDHFVLVLLVLLGFLSLQYRQLLDDFPVQVWPVYILLLAVTAFLFFAGTTATYLEEADKYFFLTKERQVVEAVAAANQRQLIIWGLVQVLGQLLFFPLYLKLGLPLWGFPHLLVLTVGKFVLIRSRLASYQKDSIFQWDLAIDRGEKTATDHFAVFCPLY